VSGKKNGKNDGGRIATPYEEVVKDNEPDAWDLREKEAGSRCERKEEECAVGINIASMLEPWYWEGL